MRSAGSQSRVQVLLVDLKRKAKTAAAAEVLAGSERGSSRWAGRQPPRHYNSLQQQQGDTSKGATVSREVVFESYIVGKPIGITVWWAAPSHPAGSAKPAGHPIAGSAKPCFP